MQRREFITLLRSAAAWPLAARAEQTVPLIGFLAPGLPNSYERAQAFRQGLQEAGHVEGQNVMLEYRWARERYERLPDLAAELVRRNVAVIVAVSTSAALAAKKATETIPILWIVRVRRRHNLSTFRFYAGPHRRGSQVELGSARRWASRKIRG